MDTNLNTAGYDLYEITKDEWILHVKDGPIFHGSFKKVAVHAIKHMGFTIYEIEAAVDNMVNRSHNAAHFGMYGDFMFSFKREFGNVQKAG